ncbi:hypothetical protein BDP27DRAFT_1430616 [Rhodocollybia butyracea]|uniref:Uncharacterized protein n=1 Tax=Rhodocollybia butyracea TaxID=206335 RepID=A0A9P5TYN1_9AGAR|nr:hypothetical protein BDP27DRAFT_1430616 [Rhodocollybia butyracea]
MPLLDLSSISSYIAQEKQLAATLERTRLVQISSKYIVSLETQRLLLNSGDATDLPTECALSLFFLLDTSHSPSGYRFHAPQCATSPSFRFDASYSPSDYIASPFLCFDYFSLRYNSDSNIVLPLSFIVHTTASSCCTPTRSPDSSVYLTCHSKLKGCLDGA